MPSYWLPSPDSSSSDERSLHPSRPGRGPELPPFVDGCEECLRDGEHWLDLRICLTCGHVGSCDDSPNRDATAHHHATSHPIIRSLESGADWCWCRSAEINTLCCSGEAGNLWDAGRFAAYVHLPDSANRRPLSATATVAAVVSATPADAADETSPSSRVPPSPATVGRPR